MPMLMTLVLPSVARGVRRRALAYRRRGSEERATAIGGNDQNGEDSMQQLHRHMMSLRRPSGVDQASPI